MIPLTTITADWVQKIIRADQELFLLLNKGYTNSFFDAVFPWFREGNTWVPFYLFLVVFAIQNFGKKAFPFILFAVVTIVLTDQISSNLVKPFFERPRPCRDPLLMNQIRMLLNQSFWFCRIPVCYNRRTYWKMEVSIVVLGGNHCLWSSICWSTFSIRHFLWCFAGIFDWMDYRILAQSNYRKNQFGRNV